MTNTNAHNKMATNAHNNTATNANNTETSTNAHNTNAHNTNTNTNTMNNSQNTNTITVHLNSYKEPSIDHINFGDFYNLLLQKGVQTANSMMDRIYYDAINAPENLSVYMVNKKSGEMSVYDGQNWISSNEKTVKPEIRNILYDLVDDLITRTIYIFQDKDTNQTTELKNRHLKRMKERQLTMRDNKDYNTSQKTIDIEVISDSILTNRNLNVDIVKKKANTVDKIARNEKDNSQTIRYLFKKHEEQAQLDRLYM